MARAIICSLAMLLGPEILKFVGCMVGYHRGFAGLPSGGTDFTVLVGVHEGLDKSKGLFDAATDGEVTDRHVSEGSFSVDDVSGTEGDSSVGTFLN